MWKFKAVESSSLSTFYKKRYVIVDEDTGEILDDAQGYGYKSPQKAHAAFAYKNRDKSRDKEKAAKKKRIQAWMKEHRDFVQDMDAIVFEMAKGSWDPKNITWIRISAPGNCSAFGKFHKTKTLVWGTSVDTRGISGCPV